MNCVQHCQGLLGNAAVHTATTAANALSPESLLPCKGRDNRLVKADTQPAQDRSSGRNGVQELVTLLSKRTETDKSKPQTKQWPSEPEGQQSSEVWSPSSGHSDHCLDEGLGPQSWGAEGRRQSSNAWLLLPARALKAPPTLTVNSRTRPLHASGHSSQFPNNKLALPI